MMVRDEGVVVKLLIAERGTGVASAGVELDGPDPEEPLLLWPVDEL